MQELRKICKKLKFHGGFLSCVQMRQLHTYVFSIKVRIFKQDVPKIT